MVIYTTKGERWQAYLHYWHFCTSTLCYNSACSAQCFSSLMWQLQSCSTSTLYAKRARLCLFPSHIIVLLLPACCTHLSQWMDLRSSTSVWACCNRDLYGLTVLVAIYFWVLRRHQACIPETAPSSSLKDFEMEQKCTALVLNIFYQLCKNNELWRSKSSIIFHVSEHCFVVVVLWCSHLATLLLEKQGETSSAFYRINKILYM